MTNEELQNLAFELKEWFDLKIDSLKDAAENVKNLNELTILINDDTELKLSTVNEVKAYRIGLLTAIGSIGEFPLEVIKK